ncbi:MAG: hypothetical protein ACREDS_14525 [Limisphaerales bacterium]
MKATLESRTGLPSALWPNAASQNPVEGWVKKKDVAKHLNISVRTLDNWMTKGVIP